MEVTRKMTLRDYDAFCQTSCPGKIPQMRNLRDKRLRLGDCIYDYSQGEPPKLRWSVHSEDHMKRDLRGQYALISDHFYYFGDKPVELPAPLSPIVHSNQSHRSNLNQPYLAGFVSWIMSLGSEPNVPLGQPQMWNTGRDRA